MGTEPLSCTRPLECVCGGRESLVGCTRLSASVWVMMGCIVGPYFRSVLGFALMEDMRNSLEPLGRWLWSRLHHLLSLGIILHSYIFTYFCILILEGKHCRVRTVAVLFKTQLPTFRAIPDGKQIRVRQERKIIGTWHTEEEGGKPHACLSCRQPNDCRNHWGGPNHLRREYVFQKPSRQGQWMGHTSLGLGWCMTLGL